eukprot:5309752-Alexandrium_andersonii.AAC.1
MARTSRPRRAPPRAGAWPAWERNPTLASAPRAAAPALPGSRVAPATAAGAARAHSPDVLRALGGRGRARALGPPGRPGRTPRGISRA